MSAVQLRQQQMAMNETMFKIILRLRWMTLVHQHRQTKVSNGHAKKALPMPWKIIVQTLRILFQHVSTCFKNKLLCCDFLQSNVFLIFLWFPLEFTLKQSDLSARAARKAESRRIVPEPIDPKASYREAKEDRKRTSRRHPHQRTHKSHKKKTDYDRLQVNLSHI